MEIKVENWIWQHFNCDSNTIQEIIPSIWTILGFWNHFKSTFSWWLRIEGRDGTMKMFPNKLRNIFSFLFYISHEHGVEVRVPAFISPYILISSKNPSVKHFKLPPLHFPVIFISVSDQSPRTTSHNTAPYNHGDGPSLWFYNFKLREGSFEALAHIPPRREPRNLMAVTHRRFCLVTNILPSNSQWHWSGKKLTFALNHQQLKGWSINFHQKYSTKVSIFFN